MDLYLLLTSLFSHGASIEEPEFASLESSPALPTPSDFEQLMESELRKLSGDELISDRLLSRLKKDTGEPIDSDSDFVEYPPAPLKSDNNLRFEQAKLPRTKTSRGKTVRSLVS